SPPPEAPVSREQMTRRMVAQTGLPEGEIVAFGDGVAIAVLSDAAGGGMRGVLHDVPLRGEVESEPVAQALGWQSMDASVDIDCVHRREKVNSMEVFADHNLFGEARKPALPAGWRAPDPKAWMGAVIAAVCRGGGAALAEAPPAPSLPTGQSAPAQGASLRPMLGAPAVVFPSPRREAKAPKESRGAAALVAQVAAAASEASARRVLADLSKPPGVSTRVEEAIVAGRKVWRALLVGFPDPGSAERFCQSLRASGRACFLRRLKGR
ncbi:MAG: SPOR domain-containing protein, partial [Caulobacteraceae bacterium]